MAIEQYNLYPGLTPVRLVSTSNIAGTYYNGQLNNGVGATLTIAASSLTIDSVVCVEGDRVLLHTQTNTNEQGIYVVDSIGATVILKRSADQQSIEQMRAGQFVTVGAGSVNAGNIYTIVEPLPGQLGIDPLIWNADPSAGGVSFSGGPSTANAIAVFSDTSGNIKAANAAPVTLGQNLSVTGTGTFSGAISSTSGNITSGSSGDSGSFISFPATAANGTFIFEALNAGGAFNTTIRNSVMGQSSVISIPDPGAATANFLLSALTGAGVQHITSGSLQVDGGGLLAGLAAGGTAASLTLYPNTTANGSFILQSVNAGGAFNTTISNGTMGQSTVYTIPDAANALGRFLVGATATPFVSGNFPVASGTGGLMVDSGVAAADIQVSTNIIAATTANIGGGGAGPISVAVAGLTAASVVVGTIESSSNAVQVQTITATATGFDVVFSADPGATCLLNFVAFIAAQ